MNIESFLLNHDILYSAYKRSGLSRLWVSYIISKRILYRMPNKSTEIVKINGFKMKLISGDEQNEEFYMDSMTGKPYDPGTTKVITEKLNAGETFIDIGANNGYFSLLASGIVGGSGKIFAFEPAPKTFRNLKENIVLNGMKNIQAFNIGLGKKKGKATFNLSNISSGQNSFVKIPQSSSSVLVDIDILDNIFSGKKIDFIKIDAEGYEEEILEGGKKVLDENRGIRLILEYSHNLLWMQGKNYDSLFRILGEHGFEIKEILPDCTLGMPISSHRQLNSTLTNLFCERR